LGEVSEPALAPAQAVANAPRLDFSLPEPAASLRRVGLDREAEFALGEVEASVSRAYPGRGSEALCSLYGSLAPAERAYRVGQRAASADELAAVPAAGRRWLWDCVYPRPYLSLVTALAREHGLEPELLYAIMRQESSFRPEAVSPAQAMGLLQLMPATAERVARELGVSFEPSRLDEPALNLRLGARYLRKLLDWFDGNVPLAVASYNAGPVAVRRWLESAGDLELDLFVARIPYEETRNYVERVVSNYARYRYLSAGQGALPKVALALPKPQLDEQDLF
jgi:soluble lytic murein transglycosylase